MFFKPKLRLPNQLPKDKFQHQAPAQSFNKHQATQTYEEWPEFPRTHRSPFFSPLTDFSGNSRAPQELTTVLVGRHLRIQTTEVPTPILSPHAFWPSLLEVSAPARSPVVKLLEPGPWESYTSPFRYRTTVLFHDFNDFFPGATECLCCKCKPSACSQISKVSFQ